MTDYSNLGYNQNLINLKSPLAQNTGAQDAYTFNSKLVDTGIDSLADQSVTQNTISQNSVAGTHLRANSVAGSHIVDGAVGQNDIASNVVQGTHITGNSITGTHIVNGGLGSDDIAAGNIHGSHISGSAIAGTHIALNAVTNDKINDYDLSKGTGVVNTTTGTFSGTVRANIAFSANGTLGISGTETLLGLTALIFEQGLLVGTA